MTKIAIYSKKKISFRSRFTAMLQLGPIVHELEQSEARESIKTYTVAIKTGSYNALHDINGKQFTYGLN